MTTRRIAKAIIPTSFHPICARLLEAQEHLKKGNFIRRDDPNPARLIGMTTLDEQEFYRSSVAAVKDVAGEIVDLGCWMCSTTISLARGVRDLQEKFPSHAIRKIYAFDRFVWEEWMNPFSSRLSCKYLNGECFMPEARGALGALEEFVELIQCDLCDYRWDKGPIKLLLVDAMKNSALARKIAEQFYPSLVPGSILIHQDYKHLHTPWIHILQYRLRDYFELYFETKQGPTLSFKTRARIPHSVVRDLQLDDLSDEDVDAAFRYSMELASDEGKSAVAAAHVMHFVHRGEHSRAWTRVERYAHMQHPHDGDFYQSKQRIQKMNAE